MNDYLASMNTLPVMPEVAAKILAMAENDMDFTFTELENIIKVDPGLTSRVLKVANSALYARSREITNLQTAIGLMGFKNLRSMVVLVTASSLYRHQSSGWILKTLWKESVIAAFSCKALAISTGNRELAEEAFLAGLLQDIGKLAFALKQPEDYATLNQTITQTSQLPDEDLSRAEEDAYKITHKKLGSEILQQWNFPEMYVDVCKNHGSLQVPNRFKKLVIIATIGATISKLSAQEPLGSSVQQFLQPFLPYLGISLEDLESFRKAQDERVERDTMFKSCMTLIA